VTAAKRESTRRDYYERMFRVLDHIHTHVDEELTLDGLARVACFSPYHFHYVFRGIVGEGLGEYLRRMRLERAWHRLLDGSRTVAEVARDAGYGSHEAFDRAFRAQFGLTPSDARRASDVRATLAPADGRLAEALAARLQRILHPASDGSELGVATRRIEPMRVGAMRQVGPYSEIGALFEKLMGWAGRNRILGPKTRVLGLCYDDPEMTPPEKCRYDACLGLDPGQSVPADGGVNEILIQGGEYAVAVHRGQHCDLPQTYAMVCGRWCPEFGRELRDVPCIENYLNHARNTAAEDLRTEIYVPLQAES
jgi:AraC family transcriptional regulator